MDPLPLFFPLSPLPPSPRSSLSQLAMDSIIVPTARAMVAEGRPFRGVLYAGLMIGEAENDAGEGSTSRDGDVASTQTLMASPPSVRLVEFNVRLGDPEAQCILPRLESDLGEVMRATAEGRLGEYMEWKAEAPSPLRWSPLSALTVVLATTGYPGPYPKRTPLDISRVDAMCAAPTAKVFHAGTAWGETDQEEEEEEEDRRLVSTGMEEDWKKKTR